MRPFLFFVLASFAVKCDDSSYYVIEMPEDDLPTKLYRKPFRVYWNVPTMQCKSKKIPFDNLKEKFGIMQNENDSFRGDKVAILYDPGLFPALLKNETSGKFKFRNGGVPQEGDLQKHLSSFRSTVEQSIPDPEFSGIGIIDFESWRPVFRQNFGVLVPYKDISYEIEKKLHWWWPKQWVQTEAKQRFEEAARKFMHTSLSVAKQMRPNALWGYYGFPYCFNMAANNMVERCAKKVNEENDGIYWLWSESTALYPSVYSSKDLTSYQLAALIRGRLREAARVKRDHTPILPYFWFRYRDGGFLSEEDLEVALRTLYKSNASGFIVWGSSKDVNTVEKCIKLKEYIENVFGPAVAKYTKDVTKLEQQVINEVNNDDNNTYHTTTTTLNPLTNIIDDKITVNTNTVPFDPEYHWVPPDNYTEDIIQYVNEELTNNNRLNSTLEEYNITTSTTDQGSLINVVINLLLDNKEGVENSTDSPNTDITDKIENTASTTTNYLISTTEFNKNEINILRENEIETSTVINAITNSPFEVSYTQKKGKSISSDITESAENIGPTTETNLKTTTTESYNIFTEEDYKQYMVDNETIADYNELNYTTTSSTSFPETLPNNIVNHENNSMNEIEVATTDSTTITALSSNITESSEVTTITDSVTATEETFSVKNRTNTISVKTEAYDVETSESALGVTTTVDYQVV